MACTACFVCHISNVSGRRKKCGASSGHITNLNQSIYSFNIYGRNHIHSLAIAIEYITNILGGDTYALRRLCHVITFAQYKSLNF